MAFVFDAETRGLEQFNVYLKSPNTDQKTLEALTEIARDEHFHMSYSRAALEKYGSEQKDALLRKIVWRRYKEAWLRFANVIGVVVSRFWLVVFYFIIVAPFRILARKEPSGWRHRDSLPSMKTAHMQG